MEKLSDEELDSIERSLGGPSHVYTSRSETCRMLAELRDLRAQRAASRERILAVVRKALRDVEYCSHLERLDGAIDRIAARAADALAAPQPVLDAARVREVVREVDIDARTIDHQHRVISEQASEINRLRIDERRNLDHIARAEAFSGKLHAELADLSSRKLITDERARQVVSACVAERLAKTSLAALDPASFGILVNEIATRVAEQLAGQAVSAGLDDQERAQLVDLLHTDAAHDHPAAEQAIRRMLAGQAVAMSAEDRKALRELREELRESMDADHRCLAAFDRLLSTPGQGASPTAGEVADPQPGPAASTVESALCWRLASEAQNRCRASMEPGGPVSWSGDKLNSVARQLTAAADLREAFDALQVVAKDAQDQLRAERDRARAAAADAHEDWKGMQAERDAARRESARLAEAFDGATGKLAVAVTAKENAERDLEAARRELAELKERHAVMVRYWDREASKICDERDAARRELAALKEQVGVLQRDLRDAKRGEDEAVADMNAIWKERDAARAECERLLTDVATHRDCHDVTAAERDSIIAAIRALLATEPAVSEERCAEIERLCLIAGDNNGVEPEFIAAARQLLALRAGLREIVVGEPAPRAWAVTPERVEALRWIGLMTARSPLSGEYLEVVDAMLAEVSP